MRPVDVVEGKAGGKVGCNRCTFDTQKYEWTEEKPEPGPNDSRTGGFRLMASVIADVFADGPPPLIFDIESVRGFSLLPGDACETATFAFLKGVDRSGRPREWFWHSSCKTQYASVISDTHLVGCHAGLVRLLDHAIAVGMRVVVRDETGYWETRDEKRLIEKVPAMNRVIAEFAGRLDDLTGSGNGRVHAPIFRHPRFERLEMGQDE